LQTLPLEISEIITQCGLCAEAMYFPHGDGAMQYTDLEFLGKISCCSVRRTDFLSIKDSIEVGLDNLLTWFFDSGTEEESLELKVRLLRRR